MRTMLAAMLCLGLMVSTAAADVAKPVTGQQSAEGKGDIPANPGAKREKVEAPRLPGAKDDCVPTGDKEGPDGCTVLKSDRNHYEWPTLDEGTQ